MMFRHSEFTAVHWTDSGMINMMIIQLLSLSAAGFVLHCKGWTPWDFGIQFSFSQCGAGLLLFLADYAAFIALYVVTANIFGLSSELRAPTFTGGFSLTAAILFSAFNAFFEEVVTVGYVLGGMRHHGRVFAVSLSMFLRFLYHTYQGPLACVSIMPMGILFASVYWRWHRLWPLVIAHFIVDAVFFLHLKATLP